MFARATVPDARPLRPRYEVTVIARRIPMMASTTVSSISVKPSPRATRCRSLSKVRRSPCRSEDEKGARVFPRPPEFRHAEACTAVRLARCGGAVGGSRAPGPAGTAPLREVRADVVGQAVAGRRADHHERAADAGVDAYEATRVGRVAGRARHVGVVAEVGVVRLCVRD